MASLNFQDSSEDSEEICPTVENDQTSNFISFCKDKDIREEINKIKKDSHTDNEASTSKYFNQNEEISSENKTASANEYAYLKESHSESKGKMYELELCVVLLTKGGNLSFDLGKEVKVAHKFDDVAIRYEDTNTMKKKHIFLQVKHVDDSETKKITTSVLSGDSSISSKVGDFDLKKYFISFLRIVNQFKEEISPNRELDKLILFTNVSDFDINDLHCNQIEATEIQNSSEREDILSILKIREESKSYKLKVGKQSNLFKELMKTESDLKRLANILSKFVKFESYNTVVQEPLDFDCLNYYHDALIKEAFEIENQKKKKSAKFKIDFITGENLSPRARKLRSELIKRVKNIKSGVSENEAIAKMKAANWKFNSKFDVINSENNIALPDYTIEENDVYNFFESLEFSVNQPSLLPLAKCIIINEIKEHFMKLIPSDFSKNVEFEINKFVRDWKNIKGEEQQENWVKNKDKNDFINYLLEKICASEAIVLSQRHMLHVTDALIDQFKDIIKFKHTYIDLQKFLENKSLQIFYIKTTQTFLSSLKVIEFLKNHETFKTNNKYYIYTNLNRLMKSEWTILSTTFSTKGHFNLLIIEWNEEHDSKMEKVQTSEIQNLFLNTIETTMDKKIILISSCTYNEVVSKEISHVVKNDVTEFCDLTDEVQKILLNKSILLQGTKKILKSVIGEKFDKIVDSGTIVKLFTDEEICVGKPPLCFSDIETSYHKLYKDINANDFANVLSNNTENAILYLITGISPNNSTTAEEMFIENLKHLSNIYEESFSAIKNKICLYSNNRNSKTIIIDLDPDDMVNLKNFKTLCHLNPGNKIYWLKLSGTDIHWQQLYNPNFYLPRQFQKHVRFSKGTLKQLVTKNLTSFLILSNTTKDELKLLLKIFRKKDINCYNRNVKNNRILFAASYIEGIKVFEVLSKNFNSPVHYLQLIILSYTHRFLWLCSSGVLDEIRKYVLKGKETYMNEGNFSKVEDRVIIIADEPGMGKSTTLTKLSTQLCRLHWVIRINIKDCMDVIQKLPSRFYDFKIETVVDFLFKVEDVGLKSSFADNVVRQAISSDCETSLLLLFDGFDEIKGNTSEEVSENQKRVINLLKFIKDKTRAKLWISTRFSQMEILENSLSVFATTFKHLSVKEQQTFLATFWQARCSLLLSPDKLAETFQLNSETNKCSKYVKALLDKTKETFGEKILRFIGIPLQMTLLAEVFQQEFLIYIKNNQETDFLFPRFDILYIYRSFIDSKYEIFFKEKIMLNAEGIKSRLVKSFNKDHQRIAFNYLFFSANNAAEVFVQKLQDNNEMSALTAIGIIQSVTLKVEIEFIHRTFAEYFAAVLLADMLKKKESNKIKYNTTLQFLVSNIWRNENEVMRKFLDCMLAENIPQHMLILNNDERQIRKLLLEGSSQFIERNDLLEKQSLHLVCQEGNLNILNILLEVSCNTMKSELFGRTPLHYCARFGHFEAVKSILDHLTDIEIGDNMFSRLLGPVDYKLCKNIFYGTEHVTSELVKAVNSCDALSQTPLWYAVSKRHWNIAILLILHGANTDSSVLLDQDKQEILRNLLNVENILKINLITQVAGYLFFQASYSLRPYIVSQQNRMLLNSFFKHAEIQVIGHLLYADTNPSHQLYRRFLKTKQLILLYNRSYFKNIRDRKIFLKILDTLLKFNCKENRNGISENISSNVLVSSMKNGCLETYDLFVIIKLVFSIKPDQYFSLCSTAAEHNQLFLVKFLCKILYFDCDKNTVLHYIVSKGSLQCIKYLIENNADINSKNKFNKTPLHIAAENNRVDVIKILIAKGARVNDMDEDQKMTLDYVFESISKTDDISCSFEKDLVNSARYLSVHCEAISALLPSRDIKEIFNRDNLVVKNMSFGIHEATRLKQINFLKFLLEQGVSVNIRDQGGKTPLHYAVTNTNAYSRYKSVIYLLEHGAIYNIKDNDNKTPLDYISNYEFEYRIKLVLELLSKMFENGCNIKEGIEKRQYKDSEDDQLFAILNARDSNENTLLHLATSFNSEIIVNYLLNNEFSSKIVNAKNKQGNTPLHFAVKKGYNEIAKLLLKHEAIFNPKNNYGQTPGNLASNIHRETFKELFCPIETLFDSIECSNIFPVINAIKELEGNVCFRDNGGRAPIHHAAAKGQLTTVRLLLKVGSNTEAEDLEQKTPLYYAAENGHSEVVRYLLHKGAAFNPKDRQGRTLVEIIKNKNDLINLMSNLFRNIQYCCPEAVIETLNNTSETSLAIKVKDHRGNTLLHYAASQDYYEIVQLLLKQGAAFDVLNKQKQTPLDLAHHQKVISLLKFVNQLFRWESPLIYSATEINQDPTKGDIIRNSRNAAGQNILHCSHISNNFYRLKYLIEKGVDINAVDNNYQRPLHIAAQHGNLRAVKLLVDKLDYVDYADRWRHTAVALATHAGHWDVVVYLIGKGARDNSVTVNGKTILQNCEDSGELDIVDLLRATNRAPHLYGDARPNRTRILSPSRVDRLFRSPIAQGVTRTLRQGPYRSTSSYPFRRNQISMLHRLQNSFSMLNDAIADGFTSRSNPLRPHLIFQLHQVQDSLASSSISYLSSRISTTQRLSVPVSNSALRNEDDVSPRSIVSLWPISTTQGLPESGLNSALRNDADVSTSSTFPLKRITTTQQLTRGRSNSEPRNEADASPSSTFPLQRITTTQKLTRARSNREPLNEADVSPNRTFPLKRITTTQQLTRGRSNSEPQNEADASPSSTFPLQRKTTTQKLTRARSNREPLNEADVSPSRTFPLKRITSTQQLTRGRSNSEPRNEADVSPSSTFSLKRITITRKLTRTRSNR